jgi:hypothetical protein
MRLTQFGYPGDPYSDSETRKGHGAYRHLQAGTSLALTDSGLRALGLSRSQVRRHEMFVDIHLRGGGVMTRRIDDRYMKSGFNRSLPDRANVTLHR